jgi:hypothetical protein
MGVGLSEDSSSATTRRMRAEKETTMDTREQLEYKLVAALGRLFDSDRYYYYQNAARDLGLQPFVRGL